MNKFITILVFLSIALISYAQSPSFKYQGVARNAQNASLNNQNISLRLSILNAANSTVYSEVHNVTTSAIGIFSVNVCQGTNPTGSCGTIDWSAGGYQLKVDMDVNGGAVFSPMGTSPILAVPVAAYALKAQSAVQGDADADPTNEIQNLTFTPATNMLSISKGNSVDLTSIKNDADADPTNEIQTLSLDTTNNQLALSKGGGYITLPSAGASLWKKNGNILSYTNGNQSITFDNVGAPPKPAYFEINFRSNANKRINSNASEWSEEYWTKPANAVGKEIAYGSHIVEYPVTLNRHYLRFNTDTFWRTSSYNYTFTPGSSPGTITQDEIFSQASNAGQPVKVLTLQADGRGGIGNYNTYLGGALRASCGSANISGIGQTPFIGLWSGSNIFGMFFDGAGKAVVQANIKNFVMDHPTDPTKEIAYASIEGPEAAAYERGTGSLINGEGEIKFTNEFGLIVNAESLTVQITPLSAESEGIAVIEKTASGFKVKEMRKGTGSYKFDWEAKGVRKGYEDYQAVRPKKTATSFSKEPYDISKAEPFQSKQNK